MGFLCRQPSNPRLAPMGVETPGGPGDLGVYVYPTPPPDPDLHLRAKGGEGGRKEPHLQGCVGGFSGLFVAVVDEGTGLAREAPDGVNGSKPAPNKVVSKLVCPGGPLTSTGCLPVIRRGEGATSPPQPEEQSNLRLKIVKKSLLGDHGCQVAHPDSKPLPAREHVSHPREEEAHASLH